MRWLIAGLVFVVLLPNSPGLSSQTAERVFEEARTVYLGNLARRQNGVPPLRWNRQLTAAARWFSWDSVENRPAGFCGHQDTQGHWPDWRARFFGYFGGAGAENAFCGYVTPEQAIDGWMHSEGHRANLLDPNSREIGLGYYVRERDGRGYVTQDFGSDPVYPPVIIENEILNVSSPLVNLYIYNRSGGGGFKGMGPAVEMKIGNDACLGNSAWEPYTAERTWSLESGQGWRSVFVKTRDSLNRTSLVSDTIYLGDPIPVAELGEAQMSTTHDRVTLYKLDGGGLPSVQFSLGWIADDTFETFGKNWGNGEKVNDPAAWGGTAYRMTPGGGETNAWVWTTDFIRDQPLVAYVRLKVPDNTSTSEVARFSATGGGTLILKGSDFSAPGKYQEFPLPFQYNSNETFLIFNIWRSGSVEVFFDAVTIFTAPAPLVSPYTWSVPGGNYRGQGVWVRYTDGAGHFSDFSEANPLPTGVRTEPGSINIFAERSGPPPAPRTIAVQSMCGTVNWTVEDNVSWMQAQKVGGQIAVTINPTGIELGSYQGTITLREAGLAAELAIIPVTLRVVNQIFPIYLPSTVK